MRLACAPGVVEGGELMFVGLGGTADMAARVVGSSVASESQAGSCTCCSSWQGFLDGRMLQADQNIPSFTMDAELDNGADKKVEQWSSRELAKCRFCRKGS